MRCRLTDTKTDRQDDVQTILSTEIETTLFSLRSRIKCWLPPAASPFCLLAAVSCRGAKSVHPPHVARAPVAVTESSCDRGMVSHESEEGCVGKAASV